MPGSAAERLLNAFAASRSGCGQNALAFRSRRGRCVSGVVSLPGGRGFFLKQDPAEGGALLRREAAVLRALSTGAGSRFAPEFIEFDPQQRILITAAARGYAPLDRILKRTLLADFRSAAEAAMALATVHQESPGMLGAETRALPFPWVPVAPLTVEEFVARPADHPRLCAVLHQSRHAIETLASRWRSSHLIHGDFKADNLLVRMDPWLQERPRIVMVDWEMAGIGDPMWDVGSFLGSILLLWIQVLAPRAASQEALAGQDANSVRRQIGYFLLTYRHMAPEVFDANESFALTAFQYAGIFMLHRVAVGLDIKGFLDPVAVLLLDFANSLLNRPEAAVAALLAGMTL